jgi:predicted nucleic acid-binding protein
VSAIVVSDASPLHYLVLCQAIDVLPQLFQHVIIPEAVITELSHPSTPLIVRNWLTLLPSWGEIRTPAMADIGNKLGAGETQAIALALELCVPAVLIDDHKAQVAAREKGLAVVGTLAILERAGEQNLIDLCAAISALRRTNFRVQPRFLVDMLRRHEERNRRKFSQ